MSYVLLEKKPMRDNTKDSSLAEDSVVNPALFHNPFSELVEYRNVVLFHTNINRYRH